MFQALELDCHIDKLLEQSGSVLSYRLANGSHVPFRGMHGQGPLPKGSLDMVTSS